MSLRLHGRIEDEEPPHSAENAARVSELAGGLVDAVLRADDGDAAAEAIDEAWLGFRFTIETHVESVGHLANA
jgi:hypothetical protein